MAIRPKDLYRGKRRYRTVILVVVGIVLLFVIGALAIFFSMQKYIVYGQDGLSLEIPFLSTESPAEETVKPTGPTLDGPVEIVITTPNFDEVQTSAGEDLSAIRAVYVPFENVDEEGVAMALDSAVEKEANALVLQLKAADGQLAYFSLLETAGDYGVNGAWDMRETVTRVKEENGLWLVAELSVCVDEAMATRNTPLALRNEQGNIYTDESGTWLDPYNRGVREYIIGLMTELSDMGFDEILLTNIAHPPEDIALTYSQDMSTAMDIPSCISNLAMKLSSAMESYETEVSAVYDAATGQDEGFFLKVFDRIYRDCTQENMEERRNEARSAMESGDVGLRFVPMMTSANDSESWLLK